MRDVHDYAKRHEGEENRVASVAEQRQRYPRNRHEGDNDADVDGDLEDDDRDDSHNDEATGQVRGGRGILNEAHEDEEIQEKDADGADEAVFFTEGGEDELV